MRIALLPVFTAAALEAAETASQPLNPPARLAAWSDSPDAYQPAISADSAALLLKLRAGLEPDGRYVPMARRPLPKAAKPVKPAKASRPAQAAQARQTMLFVEGGVQ